MRSVSSTLMAPSLVPEEQATRAKDRRVASDVAKIEQQVNDLTPAVTDLKSRVAAVEAVLP